MTAAELFDRTTRSLYTMEEALVTWITDAHHALHPSTKRALGISDLPAHYSPVPA